MMLKKTLGLALGLSMTLLVATSSFAAVHNFTSDFKNPCLTPDYNMADDPGFESWYYIGKDGPSATVRGAFSKNVNYLGGEYFLNDQTFANLTFADPDKGDSATYLKGSYLFKNGIFAGLDYGSYKEDKKDVSQVTLSPGYRFNLPKNAGYVAASMDYAASDEGRKDSGIVDFEVNGRYYIKDGRFYGQIIIPNDDVFTNDEMYLFAGGAYKVAKNIVVGANLENQDDYTRFDLGCTAGFGKLGLDFKLENVDDANNATNFYASGVYSFTNQLRGGLQINKKDAVDDPYLFAKVKYSVNNQNSLVFIHRFENLKDDATTFLRWDIALK